LTTAGGSALGGATERAERERAERERAERERAEGARGRSGALQALSIVFDIHSENKRCLTIEE